MLSKAGTFENCSWVYGNDTALQQRYSWSRPTPGIPFSNTSNRTRITLEGCLAVCGRGSDYYPWDTVNSTITTWLLPILGMLLQAPFESNAFRRTVLAITRWVGSPMASLSYVLWNIKVSGKCALMVDMALPYDDNIPGRHSNWASMRDSFYILTTMNQYQIRPRISTKKEAEGLLRIVLFSKDLRLLKDKTLLQKRARLAEQLRAGRKRGVVPIYISTWWFLFALALSIQSAFGDLGHNTTAHDLALGLLLSWLPVLILCSIVDRNPVTADDVRRRLNKLIDSVRLALQDEQIRREYINTFQDQPEAERMKEWIDSVSLESRFMYEFFVGFAGQGRVRWFYGVAHSIICNIENCYIAERGRNWLHNEMEARTHLILGPVDDEGPLWFDFRDLWQIIGAVTIVGSTIAGAFILSYYTPTPFGVGDACLVDLFASARLTSTTAVDATTVSVFATSPESPTTWGGVSVEDFAIKCLVACLSILPLMDKPHRLRQAEHTLRSHLGSFHDLTFQQKSELLFFRPLEVINAAWLLYIVMAQTVGYYRSCSCVTSVWGNSGGYLDFSQSDVTNSPWVKWYWTTGTILAVSVTGIAMVYVVAEWCLQSHLSTDDYNSARSGVRSVRRFRRLMLPVRNALHAVIAPLAAVWSRIEGLLGLSCRPQKSILWTKEITYLYSTTLKPAHHPADSANLTPPNPQVELQDYDSFKSTTLPSRQHRDAFSRSHYYQPRRDSDSDTFTQTPLIAPPSTSHSPARSHTDWDVDALSHTWSRIHHRTGAAAPRLRSTGLAAGSPWSGPPIALVYGWVNRGSRV
ncbi:hypothetical protein M432DRAFT_588227 [Thermoascus aurantiacus ATCC 26904]